MSFWLWWGRGTGEASVRRYFFGGLTTVKAAARLPHSKKCRLAAAVCGGAGAGAADSVAIAAGAIVAPAAHVSLGDIVVGPAAAVVGADFHALGGVVGQRIG